MPMAKASTPPPAAAADQRQPIPPRSESRKITGQYSLMPSRTEAAPSPPATAGVAASRSAPAPAGGNIVPAHLVKPSEVAAGKNAGRYQSRSLSRRTAELYAQYGDKVDHSAA